MTDKFDFMNELFNEEFPENQKTKMKTEEELKKLSAVYWWKLYWDWQSRLLTSQGLWSPKEINCPESAEIYARSKCKY